MGTNAQQAYLEGEILQADPLQLVRILYRVAVESVEKARQALRAGDNAERSRQITRCCEILGELALAVDHQKGGELARNLVELYDYLQRRLQEANFQRIEEPLEEAEKLIGGLLEAWEQCQPPAGTTAAAPESPVENAFVPAFEEPASYSRYSFTY
jgi:flagellar protein FliS